MKRIPQQNSPAGPWNYTNSFDRRFGPDFFKQVPEKPGVYWMQDSRRSLLYVGRSINLRRSLSSYRFIQPQAGPKRLMQLMEEVRSLGWSPTETETAASLLEKELIERHQPSFNRQASSAENHAFLALTAVYPFLEMDLIAERPQTAELSSARQIFGIFRNRPACHRAVSSMNRLLWWVGHQGHFTNLPKPLAKMLTPLGHRIDIQMDEKSFMLLIDLVKDYWSGESAHLVQLFEDTLVTWSKGSTDSFFINWIRQDIEGLRHYFSQGPEKNRKMQQLFNSQSPIEAAWVDQLVLLG